MHQTQTQRGKAFEYAIALALGRALDAPINHGSAEAAKVHYDECDGRDEMDKAAAEAALFLVAYDGQFEGAVSIELQTSTRGQAGDARDMLVRLLDGGALGISAKTHHHAIKHPRLSGNIDFGKRWADYPVSNDYWRAVRPVFNRMEEMRRDGMLFKDVPEKASSLYLPVLTAFQDEFGRLCESYNSRFITRVFQYLIGRQDFYKVVQEHDAVVVQSVNLNGTLGWGRRWAIPERIEQVQRAPGAENKILVSFAGGWQISFRLHNASSRVEPSLKFDVTFVGMPVYATGNRIPLP